FTCFNKILSRKLKERIPEFFNFMKVEQQINWDRLLCVSAWGNYGNENSGIYRYICNFYEISFYSLRECGSFDVACQKAIEQIRSKIKGYGYAFTYIFIDESQDFKESFFKLCELVTEKKCFIAGDIFQTIFEEKKKDIVPPNFLLSKCYRTDPKTLMFAQALGMGLFEKEKLWWLDKDQWEQCGYNVKIEGKQYTLTREPLRRFEDVDPNFDSLKIIEIQHIVQGTINLIKRIYEEFPTTKPDDIAIIFLDTDKYIYQSADDIERAIGLELSIECNIAYESKKTEKGKILISNKNNIKGLEYPFVICITKKILKEKSYRNTMYTMLTRSFIRSYLVLPKGDDNGFTQEMYYGGQRIMKEKKIVVIEPTDKEQIDIKAWIKGGKQALSLEDRISNVFEELNITNPKIKETIRKALINVPMKNDNAQLKGLIQAFLNTIDDEGNFA
ncbi:ATP-binding domain-containing protein, partial [Bacteroides heparinolyticus]